MGEYLVNLKLSGISYQSITTMGDDKVMRTLEKKEKGKLRKVPNPFREVHLSGKGTQKAWGDPGAPLAGI